MITRSIVILSTQTGINLSSRFNINNKAISYTDTNVETKSAKMTDYIGETSWVFKHSSTEKHPRTKENDFEVLATDYSHI